MNLDYALCGVSFPTVMCRRMRCLPPAQAPPSRSTSCWCPHTRWPSSCSSTRGPCSPSRYSTAVSAHPAVGGGSKLWMAAGDAIVCCVAGFAAGDADRAEGADESHPVSGPGQVSAASAHLEEQEGRLQQQGLQ